jgi:hypothetical protein
MAKYAKFIVAVIGAVLAAITAFLGYDLAAAGVTAESVMALLIPILTAVGVWAVPNDE